MFKATDQIPLFGETRNAEKEIAIKNKKSLNKFFSPEALKALDAVNKKIIELEAKIVKLQNLVISVREDTNDGEE